MICRNCGKKVASGNFCRECGYDNTYSSGGNGFFDILSPEALKGAENGINAGSVPSAELSEQKSQIEYLKRQYNINRIVAFATAGLSLILLILLIIAFISSGDAQNTAKNVKIDADRQIMMLKQEHSESIQTLEKKISDLQPHCIKTGDFTTEIGKNEVILIKPNGGQFNYGDKILSGNGEFSITLENDTKNIDIELIEPPVGMVFRGWQETGSSSGNKRTYEPVWMKDEHGMTDENGSDVADGIPDAYQIKLQLNDKAAEYINFEKPSTESVTVNIKATADEYKDFEENGKTIRRYFTEWKITENGKDVTNELLDENKTNPDLSSIQANGNSEYVITAQYESYVYELIAYYKNADGWTSVEPEICKVPVSTTEITNDSLNKEGYMIVNHLFKDTATQGDTHNVIPNSINTTGEEERLVLKFYYDVDKTGKITEDGNDAPNNIPDRCEIEVTFKENAETVKRDFVTVLNTENDYTEQGVISIKYEVENEITAESSTKTFQSWRIVYDKQDKTSEWLNEEASKSNVLDISNVNVTGGKKLEITAIYDLSNDTQTENTVKTNTQK